MPRYHTCKVSGDLREQKGHMCTGCPAPDLSCSLLSCNQGFKSGSNFCWHSFIKSWWCKFLLCVTILSVQIVYMVCSTLSNLQLPTEQNLLCVGTLWAGLMLDLFSLEYWWHCFHLGDLRGQDLQTGKSKQKEIVDLNSYYSCLSVWGKIIPSHS